MIKHHLPRIQHHNITLRCTPRSSFFWALALRPSARPVRSFFWALARCSCRSFRFAAAKASVASVSRWAKSSISPAACVTAESTLR